MLLVLLVFSTWLGRMRMSTLVGGGLCVGADRRARYEY